MKKSWISVMVVILVVVFAASFVMEYKVGDIAGKVLTSHKVGDAVDSLSGVKVYYNGSVSNTGDRHLATDGYNYGLRWQCVEFVKRYYYDVLHHRMPDTYGHAVSFFDTSLADGALNEQRNLIQYKNGGKTAPRVNDLLVFDKHSFNPYGHVAIVSKAGESEIEIIQQNPGPTAPSRETYKLEHKNGGWTVGRSDLLGWLRKE